MYNKEIIVTGFAKTGGNLGGILHQSKRGILHQSKHGILHQSKHRQHGLFIYMEKNRF